MTTLVEIRDGLEARLATIPRFTVARALTQATTLPAFVVSPPGARGEHAYWRTMGRDGMWGEGDWTILAALGTQLVEDVTTTSVEVADCTGELSVFALIADDPTLGGVLDGKGACVMSYQFTGVESSEGVAFFGVEFTVQIAAHRSA